MNLVSRQICSMRGRLGSFLYKRHLQAAVVVRAWTCHCPRVHCMRVTLFAEQEQGPC